jgi:hypothetical protein
MEHYLPITEIAFGAAMLVASMVVHGLGMYVVRHGAAYHRLRLRRFEREVILSLLVLLMIATHLTEVLLWAATMVWLGILPVFRDAFYYAAVTYTTLGYGENTLSHGWRILAPMMAMSGVFAFGWTTGVLWNIVSQPLTPPPAPVAPDRARR